MNQVRAKSTLDIVKQNGVPNAVAITSDFEHYSVEFLMEPKNPNSPDPRVRWVLQEPEDVFAFLEQIAETGL